MHRYFSHLLIYWQTRPIFSIFACSCAFGVGYGAPLAYDRYKQKKNPHLNPSTFTPYTLIANFPVSPTSSIFVLRPPPSAEATAFLASQWSTAASLWSVQAKQPQLQIGREYTPLPPTEALQHASNADPDSSANIHLLIRREKNGEMTTYLHGLPTSSTVHLRGPYADVRIPPHVDEVLFLAGGTGISPALQVAHIMSQRPGARITILWANRRRDEVIGAPVAKVELSGWWGAKTVTRIVKPEAEKGLVVRILEEMASKAPPGAFAVEYFVDEDDSFIKHGDIRRILTRAQAKAVVEADQQAKLQRQLGKAEVTQQTRGAKLILVSGPEGFVDYWAGKKRLEDGKEIQGPLGGALGEMDLKGWKVWKL